MLGQRRERWANLGLTLGERLVFCIPTNSPVNRRRGANVVLMMGQRRRRWPIFKTTLDQRLVFFCEETTLPQL